MGRCTVCGRSQWDGTRFLPVIRGEFRTVRNNDKYMFSFGWSGGGDLFRCIRRSESALLEALKLILSPQLHGNLPNDNSILWGNNHDSPRQDTWARYQAADFQRRFWHHGQTCRNHHRDTLLPVQRTYTTG